MASSPMMIFDVPSDPELLKAIGTVSIRHAHLEHILRMTIKTLAGISIQEALDGTAFNGPATLRDRINRLARMRLGEGAPLIRLQALLERCRQATGKRNDLIHALFAREMDGDPQVRTPQHTWVSLPTVPQLESLSQELAALTNELNEARLHGYVQLALTNRKLPDGH